MNHTWRFKDYVKILLEHGANTEVKDKYGQTVLFQALYHKDTVEVLCQNGAKIEAKTDNGLDDGRTPLIDAAVTGKKDSVEVLLR